jgi:signal transduction histidine kinase
VRRALVVLGTSALGIAAGAYTLGVARGHPAISFPGRSALRDAALLAAGWAAIAAGLAFWWRRPASRFSPLLTAGGFAWFLLEWNNPGIGSPLAFTVGLVLFAAAPPLFAHAVLAYPAGRPGSSLERAALAGAYLGAVVLLGLLPAMFLDPQAEDCFDCPRNLVLVSNRPSLSADLTRIGIRVGLAWAIVLALVVAWKLVRTLRTGRTAGRVPLGAGAAYLALVAAFFGASAGAGVVSNGTLEQRLWLGQAAAVIAVAAGIVWNLARVRRARSAVTRLVVDLGSAPPAGGLKELFAGIVGDPELVLAYPVGESGRLVDSRGRPVDLSDRQEHTSLVRDARPVAVLSHKPGLLQDEQLVDELTAAARLALENERLQAEVHARVEELRRSRARLVEAGDAERKRLERNLHDGAQQQLVALSLSLGLLRTRLADDGGAVSSAQLEEANEELRRAIAELRSVAHGLFPAVLAEEGFAAAVAALSEEARVPIKIGRLPEERCSSRAETAAYTVVASVARTATSTVTVSAEHRGDTLVVEVETTDNDVDVVELEDRVRAVDGLLDVTRTDDGRLRIRAEAPCAS